MSVDLPPIVLDIAIAIARNTKVLFKRGGQTRMKPLYFPTEIFFEEVFEDFKNYSDERILIITSRHGADSDGAQKLVKVAESNNEVHVFNEVKSDPPLSIIAKGKKRLKNLNQV